MIRARIDPVIYARARTDHALTQTAAGFFTVKEEESWRRAAVSTHVQQAISAAFTAKEISSIQSQVVCLEEGGERV